mmetsp:Transcript_45241/g.79797  ORF Transcript_45241/g.79797 Transcript_45241/m.79797 type:complete len:282 (+) Transcript_45241:3-848(+)
MTRQVIAERASLATFRSARNYTYAALSKGAATAAQLEAASLPLRAQQLWQRPVQLSELLMMAQYLGIDPVTEPVLMWVAHYASVLPIPLGWTIHQPDGTLVEVHTPHEMLVHFEHFYYYEPLQLSQWEPPQWSYCRGLIAGLRDHKEESEKTQQAGIISVRPRAGRASAARFSSTQTAKKLKEAEEWDAQRAELSAQSEAVREAHTAMREERKHPFINVQYCTALHTRKKRVHHFLAEADNPNDAEPSGHAHPIFETRRSAWKVQQDILDDEMQSTSASFK